ncbi:MAG: thioredoxin family protein, partial [Bacteroidales bacterium]
FAFALALAIPFALFAIFPSAIKSLPKSGGWLNSIKVILAFLELAFALKFLSVADLAYGWGILPRETFVALWVIIFFLMGLYLMGAIRFKNDSKPEYLSVLRLFLAIIPMTFAIYMIPGLWGAPLKAISAFAPPANTQDFNLYRGETHAVFNDYDEAMTYARKHNKPLFIDFSGYGCVNCRKMEASVFTAPEVKEILDNDYVFVTLMVDDKRLLPEPMEVTEYGKQRTLTTVGDKWSFLQRYKFGANAQPYYVLLSPDGKPLAAPYGYNENVKSFVDFLER